MKKKQEIIDKIISLKWERQQAFLKANKAVTIKKGDYWTGRANAHQYKINALRWVLKQITSLN